MNEAQELARALVTEVADDAPKWRPTLHRAARLLVTGQRPDSGCLNCGDDVDQGHRGRPRLYCPTCSPRKPRRKNREKGRV